MLSSCRLARRWPVQRRKFLHRAISNIRHRRRCVPERLGHGCGPRGSCQESHVIESFWVMGLISVYVPGGVAHWASAVACRCAGSGAGSDLYRGSGVPGLDAWHCPRAGARQCPWRRTLAVAGVGGCSGSHGGCIRRPGCSRHSTWRRYRQGEP